MVRILKSWNGASNMDIMPFEGYRLYGKKVIIRAMSNCASFQIEDAPLPLYKSSVSVIMPREAADFLVSSTVTQKLLDFINGTGHSDETFWGTLIGNRKGEKGCHKLLLTDLNFMCLNINRRSYSLL